MDSWKDLERSLAEITSAASVEVREDGEWLVELSKIQSELRPQGTHHVVHLWSESRNLARRVLRIAECSSAGIILEVQRFGNPRPGKLEILPAGAPRSERRMTREMFRSRFRRVLSEQFPDAEIGDFTAAADLEHSLSGVYVRGRIFERGAEWAVLGVSPSEDSAAMDGALAAGLLWLDLLRRRAARRPIQGLRLILPAGSSNATLQRLRGLVPRQIEVFEFEPESERIRTCDPALAGNTASWIVPRRDSQSTLAAIPAEIEQICALHREAIDARPVPGKREVVFRFRGLEFASWREGSIMFGKGDNWRALSEMNRHELSALVRELDLHRNPLASDPTHSLFRGRPERWLETTIAADPSRLDARLNPRELYSQVPAIAAGDRGVMDLLGVTREGRLVVMELKASEDLHLPLQALDYWLRVRWHQREGDFQRNGYFSGITLDERPPLVWLVAPGLRFHPSTDILLKYFSPEVQVTRIGLAENWRCGIQVVFRM
ncbi:MAG: hypothetical protein ACRD50_08140 [Candidatus Acidiferrales bacterium]